MVQSEIWALVNYTANLTSLRDDLQERLNIAMEVRRPAADLRNEDLRNLQVVLGQFQKLLQYHGLHSSLDRLARINELLEDPETVIRDVIPQLRTLEETIEDELKRRFFMYLPPDDATLYQQPLAQFPNSLNAFPSAKGNMIGACRCQSIGQHTACVFHCMGILQGGLYALAKELNVSFAFPIELAEWHKIITKIEDAIAPLRNSLRAC
jgi:hypothetical protein